MAPIEVLTSERISFHDQTNEVPQNPRPLFYPFSPRLVELSVCLCEYSENLLWLIFQQTYQEQHSPRNQNITGCVTYEPQLVQYRERSASKNDHHWNLK